MKELQEAREAYLFWERRSFNFAGAKKFVAIERQRALRRYVALVARQWIMR